jgi:hypothetical protein
MMLRDLNQVRDGKRILDTPWVGVLGATIPSTGSNGVPALLYNDVISDSLQTNAVRIWITSHNFDTFYVYDDSSYTFTVSADGIYTATGVLIVDDVDQNAPATVLTVNIGNTLLNAAAALAVKTTPVMAAAATVSGVLSATATLGVTTTPDLATTAGSSQQITATATLTLQTYPGLLAAAAFGGTLPVTATLDITVTPSISALVFTGYQLPDTIAPSRLTAVDLDSDATHPAAVFIKDPQAVLDYGIDITAWLADSQDTLAGFNAAPTEGSDVSVHAEGMVGGVMAAMIGGGTIGAPNAVMFDFQTLGGRHDQRTIYFQIQDR